MYSIPFLSMMNILQLIILDKCFNHILKLVYATGEGIAPFCGRTYAKVFLGHFSVLMMAVSKQANKNKKQHTLFAECGKIGNLVYCRWDYKIVQPL